MWDGVQVWYACRNATAHYGKFHIGDPEQKKQWWYPFALKAYTIVAAKGGYGEFDDYFDNLAMAGKRMVQWMLDTETAS